MKLTQVEQVFVDLEDDLKRILSVSQELSLDFFDNVDEALLERLNDYLEDLEEWQIAYKQSLTLQANDIEPSYPGPNADALKAMLQELGLTHAKIMNKSSGLMSDVQVEIGKVARSTNVIKSYINSSIGVTRGTTKKG